MSIVLFYFQSLARKRWVAKHHKVAKKQSKSKHLGLAVKHTKRSLKGQRRRYDNLLRSTDEPNDFPSKNRTKDVQESLVTSIRPDDADQDCMYKAASKRRRKHESTTTRKEVCPEKESGRYAETIKAMPSGTTRQRPSGKGGEYQQVKSSHGLPDEKGNSPGKKRKMGSKEDGLTKKAKLDATCTKSSKGIESVVQRLKTATSAVDKAGGCKRAKIVKVASEKQQGQNRQIETDGNKSQTKKRSRLCRKHDQQQGAAVEEMCGKSEDRKLTKKQQVKIRQSQSKTKKKKGRSLSATSECSPKRTNKSRHVGGKQRDTSKCVTSRDEEVNKAEMGKESSVKKGIDSKEESIVKASDDATVMKTETAKPMKEGNPSSDVAQVVADISSKTKTSKRKRGKKKRKRDAVVDKAEISARVGATEDKEHHAMVESEDMMNKPADINIQTSGDEDNLANQDPHGKMATRKERPLDLEQRHGPARAECTGCGSKSPINTPTMEGRCDSSDRQRASSNSARKRLLFDSDEKAGPKANQTDAIQGEQYSPEVGISGEDADEPGNLKMVRSTRAEDGIQDAEIQKAKNKMVGMDGRKYSPEAEGSKEDADESGNSKMTRSTKPTAGTQVADIQKAKKKLEVEFHIVSSGTPLPSSQNEGSLSSPSPQTSLVSPASKRHARTMNVSRPKGKIICKSAPSSSARPDTKKTKKRRNSVDGHAASNTTGEAVCDDVDTVQEHDISDENMLVDVTMVTEGSNYFVQPNSDEQGVDTVQSNASKVSNNMVHSNAAKVSSDVIESNSVSDDEQDHSGSNNISSTRGKVWDDFITESKPDSILERCDVGIVITQQTTVSSDTEEPLARADKVEMDTKTTRTSMSSLVAASANEQNTSLEISFDAKDTPLNLLDLSTSSSRASWCASNDVSSSSVVEEDALTLRLNLLNQSTSSPEELKEGGNKVVTSSAKKDVFLVTKYNDVALLCEEMLSSIEGANQVQVNSIKEISEAQDVVCGSQENVYTSSVDEKPLEDQDVSSGRDVRIVAMVTPEPCKEGETSQGSQEIVCIQMGQIVSTGFTLETVSSHDEENRNPRQESCKPCDDAELEARSGSDDIVLDEELSTETADSCATLVDPADSDKADNTTDDRDDTLLTKLKERDESASSMEDDDDDDDNVGIPQKLSKKHQHQPWSRSGYSKRRRPIRKQASVAGHNEVSDWSC